MSDRLTTWRELDGLEVWLVDPHGEGRIDDLTAIEADAATAAQPNAALAANADAGDGARVDQLLAAGYARTFSMVAMERDLSPIGGSMAVNTRPASDSDAQTMLALTQEVWAEREFFTMPTLWQYETWLAESDPSWFRLVEEDGRLVGYVATRDDGSGGLEIDDLQVAPSRQRHGIGRALLAEAIELGRARGLIRAWLTTEGDDPAGARRFYESVGFSTTAEALRFRKPFPTT